MRNQGTTLVLFDYHHDVGPDYTSILSSNWISELILNGGVSKVLWVSGRDLLLPNRNARIAWLNRKLHGLSPDDARRVEEVLVLADWHDLESTKIPGPIIISVDFDIFCHDPGNPPERFVDEIASWTAGQKTGLITLALSAAYQRESRFTWDYFERFIDVYSALSPKAAWFLEAGPYGVTSEGEEELASWRLWETDPDAFGNREGSFLPGAAIWLNPPVSLRDRLIALGIQPGDSIAEDIIGGWKDEALTRLERDFPVRLTDEMLAAAAASLESSWKGETSVLPEKGDYSFGLALRIQSNGGDRGCFALYRGLSDPLSAAAYCASLAARDPRYPEITEAERSSITLEVSLFGDWTAMRDPEDFLPGRDSLLLINGKETTLLQAPLAAERGYGRIEFLERLSQKAGLGLDGWKSPAVRFEKAITIWSRKPLVSIENSPDYQKYEKK